MARNWTIMNEIRTCSDADSLVRILNEHFSTSVTQTLEQVISGVETLLEKSKQRDKDKKRIIPEYLSNVATLKAMVTLLGRIPAIVNSQRQRNDALAANLAKERYLVQELSIKETKIKNMETTNANAIDELTKTLEQKKQRIEFLERAKRHMEQNRDKMETELWQMKQQVDTMKLQPPQTPNTNSDAHRRDKDFIEYVSQEHCGKLEVAEILEEYEQLTWVHWLSAKERLDDKCSQDIDEKSKLQMLCDVIMDSWRAAVTAVVTGVPEESSTKPSTFQICTEKLDNSFGGDGKSKAYRNSWSMVKDCQEIQDYSKSVLRIALAMVLQDPQLEFKLSDTYLGETCQELHFNSVNPQETTEYCLCHVYPMITRNGEPLAKGKVLLMNPQKPKSTFPFLNDSQGESESHI